MRLYSVWILDIVPPAEAVSPAVVLREAEQALLVAKATGPESIQCSGDFPEPCAAPVAFLSSTSGDELLAW